MNEDTDVLDQLSDICKPVSDFWILLSIPLTTALCDLFYTIDQGRHNSMAVAPFQYISPSVIAVSMGVSGIVQQNDRHLGRRTSGLMFLFWLALAVYGTVKMRTYILRIIGQPDAVDTVRYSAFVFQYITYLVELVLSVIPEAKSKGKDVTEKPRRKASPEEDATFLSQITWWWQNGQIWYGWRHTITYDDLADLNSVDKSENIVPVFQRNWNSELKCSSRRCVCKEPSLVVTLARTFGKSIVMAGIFKLVRDVLTNVSPQILKLMIKFTQDESQPDFYGYIYAILLFVVVLLQSLLLNQFFHLSKTVGMRVRAAIITAVYSKSLCLSNSARRTTTVGEIVNLMSVDVQCVSDFLPNLHLLWSAPFQVVIAIVSLYFTMGISIFAGVGVMVAVIPLNACLGGWGRKIQAEQMRYKDTRTKIINEVLHGIKVIKLYVWEIPFQQIIFGIRKNELKKVSAKAYLKSMLFFIWTSTPFLVALATFVTYSLIYINDSEMRLTADKAFVALSLFNLLRNPFNVLPTLISNVIQVNISIKRLRRFLMDEELDPNCVARFDLPALDTESSISITKGTFRWDRENPECPTLSSINLEVARGQLIAVVGKVGAGKSSLLQAILGEMEKVEGNVTIKGSVAYIPQQAWIQNATLRDNILFEWSLENVKYERVIKACALLPDIEILPGGDLTEIGEKGINLSGGQKQRVSLARAVYHGSDIYLMDDPLSAVDPHVGKYIFETVIGPQGILKDKTRVLVTHGVGYLPQCDTIIVMTDGVISEMGTYSELLDTDGAFAQFIREYHVKSEEEEEEIDDGHAGDSFGGYQSHLSWDAATDSKIRLDLSDQSTMSSDTEDELTEHSVLITEEKTESGIVKLSVVLAYCRACAWPMIWTTLLFFLLTHGASIASSFWLAKWSNAQTNELAFERNESVSLHHITFCDNANISAIGCYLGIYAGLGGAQSLFSLFSTISLTVAALFASKTLHNKLLSNILRCPMSFFETTPLGRILNRFSLDIFIIDETIPTTIQSFLYRILSAIGVLLVVSVATPMFIAVIVPLGVFYCGTQRFYMATSRQLKRLESTSRSPIYSHFQETIMGVSSIRAYCQQDRFIEESQRRVDYNHLALYPAICAGRWLANWVKLVGNLVVFFAALFAAIERNYRHEIDLPVSAGLIGLSITYALEINQHLTYVLQNTCELESSFIAVERVKEYSETTTEAPAKKDDHRPPDDWPSKGHITFNHYSTRYRKGLDLVLRDISVEISGGTKVGIVGRTGAGKSSLALAMFRIIEPAGGAILVDGVDVSQLGLDDLRSRITIIPQDPVLISGTLKMNLDPFGCYSDDELWYALERAHLNNFVSSLERKLSHHITEYGENLSVGQCQLVCLARALLQKTKILVLDEATAAVDLKTDNLIQETIRSDFHDCTVITIAHRLNTILDYDRVIVLDKGCVVEDGNPKELLSDKSSIFCSMAKEAGIPIKCQ